ncbi:VWA domain-containing protein [Nanchangia anserum]|uniref:VWA domain-containing protein n=1 Tax=Nanchangia anserum TaxID=2692125 RepID=A0A8I0KUB8_9ACTO|nr:VWA domain-containing protein [Nanchangia anserum]MBD3689528.1 VWA domain-containing protein [Nanchangia anserum]QOX81718.1 VWA domain-containing protein [Nanchangia anserum]
MSLDWNIPAPVCIAFVAWAVVILVAQAVRDGRRARWVWGRRAAMAVLILIMGITPSLPQATSAFVSSLNVVIVVDKTTSMSAADMPGGTSRLDAMRADMREIASTLSGARFEIITVAGRAQRELPWTTDAGAVVAYADALTPEIAYYATGTDVSIAASMANSDARSATEDAGRAALIILSDGEGTASSLATSHYDDAVFSQGIVATYGTRQGGTMRPYLGGGKFGDEIRDPETGAAAVSHADPEAMAKLASQLGIPAVNRGAGEELTGALHRLVSDDGDTVTVETTVPRHVIWPLTWILVGLVAWEIFAQARFTRIRRDRIRQLHTPTTGGER